MRGLSARAELLVYCTLLFSCWVDVFLDTKCCRWWMMTNAELCSLPAHARETNKTGVVEFSHRCKQVAMHTASNISLANTHMYNTTEWSLISLYKRKRMVQQHYRQAVDTANLASRPTAWCCHLAKRTLTAWFQSHCPSALRVSWRHM